MMKTRPFHGRPTEDTCTMKIDLIALDLDGTFIRSDGTVSDRNLRAVRRAAEAGVRVVVASGRIRGDAASFREIVDPYSPTITANGAAVINGALDRPLLSRTVSPEAAERTVSLIHRFGVACHAYLDGSVVMERDSPVLKWYRHRSAALPERFRFQVIETEDLLEWLSGPDNPRSLMPEKIMTVEYDPERMEKLASALQAVDGISLTGSSRTNREILGEGVSKGAALGFLCGKFGIPPSRVMAIGDNENDLSMLEFAGIPVAMGNAPDAVKAAARHVTARNDEDGVAHAIEAVLEGSL
jgi:Cof subfamily protein (haloacid dehalogenase superfamily)